MRMSVLRSVLMLLAFVAPLSALAAPYGFVGVDGSGTGFELYGQPFTYVGVNCYYLFDYGTGTTYDDSGNLISNSKQYVQEVLNEAQSLGIKVIRTWAFASGDASVPLGGQYNLFELGSPGNYQETTFRGLDYVVAEASKRGIRVLPVLVNNWDNYGGMKWYVDRSPTTNKTLTGDEYHDQFYTDPNCQAYYQNYVANLLNRVNTYTGIAYKDDPAIFAWELTNEARAKSTAPGSATLDAWIATMSAYVKSIDPDHLLTTGIEGWGSPWEGTNFVSSQFNTNIDFATFHFYPDHWDFFPQASGERAGIDQDKIDWWTSALGITWLDGTSYDPALGVGGYDNWAAQHAAWAAALLGKPVVLGEIGLLRSNDDALEDRFYRQAIDSFFGAGGDGIHFWGLAHDAYAAMDDGFLFYISSNPALSGPSQPALGAIQYARERWANTPESDPALTLIPEAGGLASLLVALGGLACKRRQSRLCRT